MTVTADPTPEPSVDPRAERARALWQAGRARASRLPEWLVISGFLLVIVAISVYFRTRQIGGQFWMDEAITVGIASHPLSQIPGIMRMDGSPPLFYMILHFWMTWFGNTEAATHSLSVIFGALTIPVGYWGGRTLVNKKAGVYAAVLFATNAFITGYSDETRMYALMVLLGLLATIGFIKGFVYRERRYVVLFSIMQALMLYTHSWGLFYGAASFVSLVILWRISDQAARQNFIRDAVMAYIGVALIYAVWVPNFIFQATHTAAPWDTRPRFGLPVQIAQGIMGTDSIGGATFVVAAIGGWGLLGRAKRLSTEAKVMYMLIGLAAFTFVFGWIASQITPAWVVRYFAPTVGPILLFLALGMARVRVLGIIALLVACTAILHPGEFAPANKSDMRYLSGALASRLHPGDLVIVGQPEETPLAYYYFPAGLHWANTMGPVKDPTYMNWVDAMKRYKAAIPDKVLPPMLKALKPGQQLLYIQPLTEGNANWIAPWTELIRLRSAQWGAIIAADKQLKEEAWAPHDYLGACCVADSAVLYKKVS